MDSKWRKERKQLNDKGGYDSNLKKTWPTSSARIPLAAPPPPNLSLPLLTTFKPAIILFSLYHILDRQVRYYTYTTP